MAGKRKSKTPPKLPERLDELRIERNGKGRYLKPGMTVKIAGATGEWRIKYIELDGSLTVFGGRKGYGKVRTFPNERYRSTVRNTRERAEALDAAAHSE